MCEVVDIRPADDPSASDSSFMTASEIAVDGGLAQL
jgi:hypothetical protein